MSLERKTGESMHERLDSFLTRGNKGLARIMARVVDEQNLRGTLYALGAAFALDSAILTEQALPLIIGAGNLVSCIRTADNEPAFGENPNKREKICLATLYIIGACAASYGAGLLVMGGAYHNRETLRGGLMFLTMGLSMFNYAAAEYIGRKNS